MRQKGLKPKSWNQYRKIMLAMGESMSDILIERGIVTLPWKCGEVYMKRKKDVVAVDKLESSRQKKKVLHFNDHSDGIFYEPFWRSPQRKSKKQRTWCFSQFRGARRKMFRLVIEKKVEYPDFEMLKLEINQT